jgi:CubicO group peptidase (beta-lactamase class C family)
MLSDATGNVRVRAIDPDQGIPSSRSIGLVVKGEDPHNTRRGMGRTCSGLSFGHNGVGGQVAWADPLSGISFCLLTNALDANPIRSARFTNAINNRAGVLHQPTTE